MPFSDLNKVVSLFLVGSLVLLLLAALGFEELTSAMGKTGFDSAENKPTGFILLVGTFAFFGLSALAGAMIEGLTDLTLRNWIKKSRGNSRVAYWFRQPKILKTHDFWENEFKKVAKSSGRHTGSEFPIDERSTSLAVGICFATASKDLVDWMIGHYATFVLVSNFAFIMALVQLYLVYSLAAGEMPLILFAVAECVCFVLFYSLCSLAVDRYLYSFVIAFRHATLEICREGKSELGLEQELTDE